MIRGQYLDTLWATGYNYYGELGISTADQTPKTQSNIFQPILSDVKFAAGGFYRTNVVKKDGSVWGAGYNLYGQIGDGTKVDKKEKFVKSNIESGAVYVSAGFTTLRCSRTTAVCGLQVTTSLVRLGMGQTSTKPVL